VDGSLRILGIKGRSLMASVESFSIDNKQMDMDDTRLHRETQDERGGEWLSGLDWECGVVLVRKHCFAPQKGPFMFCELVCENLLQSEPFLLTHG